VPLTGVIALDGPSGTGKSSVARTLARRLHARYLDTGAMYRAVTWLALQRGLPLWDSAPLGALAAANPVTFDERGRVFIAGMDVTASIRKSNIDRNVPVVARHPEVRQVMRERQRELGEQGDVVIEGRDIGTVVAPDAEVKVYLSADASTRTRRRQAERPDIGGDALATDLRLRDESDAARMRPAADAEQIDTTELEVDDVVSRIEEIVQQRLAASRS
jgi:CMP/dCMP kinase